MDSHYYRVVTNPDVLSAEHMPSTIHSRQDQVRELQFCLLPAATGSRPRHVWLHGKPGTGKTTVAKHLLEKLRQEAGVRGVYINCWQRTFYSVIDEILDDLRVLRAERRETAFKLDELKRCIGGKPFIMVLDEIDQMSPKERDALLYNLCFGNVGLICISYSRSALAFLDGRVSSRLLPCQIAFDPYTTEELVTLLRDRAEEALAPDTWSNQMLEDVAQLAEGNATVAIHTLRSAAHFAERERSKFTERRHVEKGFTSTRHLKKMYLLKSLTEHHQLLHRIIKEKEGIESGDLKKEYLRRCQERGLEPAAVRTVDEYLLKMVRLKLIERKRARKRGKVFSYRVVS